MSGLSNYTANAQLGFITGQGALAAPAGVWLALMTAVDTDAGTGGTEVTGGAYTRVQVAGSLATNASGVTASTTFTLASAAPAWLTALGTSGSGVTVWTTAGVFIGTVSTISSATVTLTGTAATTVAANGNVYFSAFGQPTGSAPSSTANGAAITFPQATASWGTVVAFELRDASTAGNLLAWDYMGGFPWQPATVSAASPGVITAHAHAIANGGSFVFSTEYGGTALTFSASNYTGIQTAAGVTADTLQVTGANTSTTGNGMIRQVTQQPIAINVTASFAASQLTITSA